MSPGCACATSSSSKGSSQSPPLFCLSLSSWAVVTGATSKWATSSDTTSKLPAA
ncbi:MAG: hypothetical protein ACK55Z_25595 [bacterium]